MKIRLPRIRRRVFFLLVFSVLTLLHGAVIWYLYSQQYNKSLALIKEAQENMIHFEEQTLRRSLGDTVRTLDFMENVLREGYGLGGLFAARRMDSVFSTLSDLYSAEYRRISIVSLQGYEILAYEPKRGMNTQPLPEERKKDWQYEPFFWNLMESRAHHLMSPVQLETIEGEVMEPRRPLMMVGRKVLNREGEPIALLVLSSNFEPILANLGNYGILPEESFFTYLLNDSGFWLRGPEEEPTFGFMFPEGNADSIAVSNPELWTRLIADGKGAFFLKGHHYLFRTLTVEQERRAGESGQSLLLVYHTPAGEIASLKRRILLSLLFPFLVTESIIAFVAFLSALWLYRMHQYRKQLLLDSSIDELTGCMNRKAGTKALEQSMALGKRGNYPLTIAFLDLNDLKTVNDTIGHKEGDRYITTMVDLVREQLRGSDLMVRLGGDEFLLILPECRFRDACRIRRRVLEKEIKLNKADLFDYKLSMSWGIFEISPADDIGPVEAIHKADEKMYEEKNNYPDSADKVRCGAH